MKGPILLQYLISKHDANVITFSVYAAVGVIILFFLFFSNTLQKTLEEISPENQKMYPGNVWLSLIPVFGFVWGFIVVNRMADSLEAEFSKRNIQINENRPGYSIGITYCVLFCCSCIPIIGIIPFIAGWVFLIVYWIKINNYKIKLQQTRSLV